MIAAPAATAYKSASPVYSLNLNPVPDPCSTSNGSMLSSSRPSPLQSAPTNLSCTLIQPEGRPRRHQETVRSRLDLVADHVVIRDLHAHAPRIRGRQPGKSSYFRSPVPSTPAPAPRASFMRFFRDQNRSPSDPRTANRFRSPVAQMFLRHPNNPSKVLLAYLLPANPSRNTSRHHLSFAGPTPIVYPVQYPHQPIWRRLRHSFQAYRIRRLNSLRVFPAHRRQIIRITSPPFSRLPCQELDSPRIKGSAESCPRDTRREKPDTHVVNREHHRQVPNQRIISVRRRSSTGPAPSASRGNETRRRPDVLGHTNCARQNSVTVPRCRILSAASAVTSIAVEIPGIIHEVIPPPFNSVPIGNRGNRSRVRHRWSSSHQNRRHLRPRYRGTPRTSWLRHQRLRQRPPLVRQAARLRNGSPSDAKIEFSRHFSHRLTG